MLSSSVHGVDGRWKWLSGIGGMAVIGENQSTWRKTCPIATLSIRDSMLNGLGFNLALCSDRPMTADPSLHRITWQVKFV